MLAGGLSSRMGTPKATLEWHGSTLLRRTVGIVARATGGTVVVVRAKGQDLPALPGNVEVTDDPREGKGPVQGIAAGLAALRGRTDVAFVCSTDLPFLHPAFVDRVLGGIGASDVALPVAHGYKQPLAAAYRVSLADTAERLVTEGRLRPAFLFDECSVVRLDEDALTTALDPDLDSVVNVNTPADYQAARARPAPEVTVELVGADGKHMVRAATLGAAAGAVNLALGQHGTVALNGHQITPDEQTPLAAGDTVLLLPAAAGGLARLSPAAGDIGQVTNGEA